jgi:tRNA-splicing ligase RtcB
MDKKRQLEIKKAFLQGLFDSELSNSSISTYKNHKNNLGSPRMEMCKSIELEFSLKTYLEEIKDLLSEFNISSSVRYIGSYDKNKISYSLVISNKLKNIESFIKKIGFYYSNERKIKSKKILDIINKKLYK